jgi:hypothetical protein
VDARIPDPARGVINCYSKIFNLTCKTLCLKWLKLEQKKPHKVKCSRVIGSNPVYAVRNNLPKQKLEFSLA